MTRDLAGRGLLREGLNDWRERGVSSLAETARSLHGRLAGPAPARVAIITGFFIPGANPPAAETDGPPGAVLLADLLRAFGAECRLVTDSHCAASLAIAMRAADLAPDTLTVVDAVDAEPDWLDSQSTVIAIERVGPSHTSASLAAQTRRGPVPTDEFERLVPQSHRDRCHNMRGDLIDTWTAPLWRLIESTRRRGGLTIGIGDGGNELGMGRIPWEDLQQRLSGSQAGWVPCRVATDFLLLAGVSNWGGFALGAALCAFQNDLGPLARWTSDRHRRLLHEMVAEGPAVDGVSRRQEPTVDGLPLDVHLALFEEMQAAVRAGERGA